MLRSSSGKVQPQVEFTSSMPPHIQKAILSPLSACAWSFVLFLFAAFLALPEWHGLFATVPEEAGLQKAEGTLSSFHQFTNAEGLRFRLSGSDKYFVLSNYSGAEPAVRRAPPGAQFAVLYDPLSQSGTIWTSRRSHVVYVVFVNGSPIRSYEQVAQAARADVAWTPWVTLVLTLGGLTILLWASWLQLLRWRIATKSQKAG
jgi:hypothetical protein